MSDKTDAVSVTRTAIEAVVEAVSIGRPQLSPDGRWILYAQRRGVVSQNEHRYSLWAVPVAGGDVPRLLFEADPTTELFKVVEAEWSPDSRQLALIEGGTVHLLPVPAGEPTDAHLAEGGELSALT